MHPNQVHPGQAHQGSPYAGQRQPGPPPGHPPHAGQTMPDQQTTGNLNWLLTSFARQVPDVAHAVAVSGDGLRLANSADLPIDMADQLAAVISGLASLCAGTARVLSAGGVRQSIVDMDGGVMLIMAVGDRALLGVLAAPGCDLGQVGYETAMLVQRVADALEPAGRS